MRAGPGSTAKRRARTKKRASPLSNEPSTLSGSRSRLSARATDPETGVLLSQTERRKRGGYSARERLFAPGSLFTVLSAADTLVLYSQSVLKFTRRLLNLAQQRRRSKLWFPTGLRKIGHLLAGHHRGTTSGVDFAAGGEDPDRVDEEPVDDDDASSDEATLSSRRDRTAAGEKEKSSSSLSGKKSKKKKDKKPENRFDKLMKTQSKSRRCGPNAAPEFLVVDGFPGGQIAIRTPKRLETPCNASALSATSL